MKTINEIQKIIIEIGKIINSPKELLTVFNSPQPDGTPYINTNNNQYHYIIEERGNIFQKKSTDSLDLLIYWIVSDIVFDISVEYELNHRKENKDSRRLIFEHELHLFKKINNAWYEKRKKEIEITLINAPYEDI
ncbi:Imm63 family immunity protein [Pantoea sp. 18069]|uniref:Imm63 family immunity protein n=1 Tax=Pantoea sp. 18069 TaxID=2681415 RepID=UPI00135B3A22|nr:Imm63 family immunity protein [Pantoea sp. 18069]